MIFKNVEFSAFKLQADLMKRRKIFLQNFNLPRKTGSIKIPGTEIRKYRKYLFIVTMERCFRVSGPGIFIEKISCILCGMKICIQYFGFFGL